MRGKLTLLFIGDVVGRIGRRAVEETIPRLKKKYAPDCIIANVENLAHGKGVSENTLSEMKRAGIDAFTGGNHIWSKADPTDPAIQNIRPLAIPANDPRTPPEFQIQKIPCGASTLTLINLLGQFEMHDEGIANPYTTFDTLYEEAGNPPVCIVDFHAEATSEKVAFGFHADGRASVVFGTHTHIPTADERILPGGTGYITDVGMTGSNDSVLGVSKKVILDRFVNGGKATFEYPEVGPAWVNAVWCELDKNTGKCVKLERIQEHLTIN